jgi:general secretion pathway protein K
MRSSSARSTNGNNGERGFTFLVVIWALSILIVLALVFGATVSAHLKATRNAVDNARAEALADAGVKLAVLSLAAWRAQMERDPRFPRNGRPVRCSLGDGDWLSIAVEDEAGKVDLNMADERLVAAALIAAGVAADEGADLAQRILDYRDDDNDRRPKGAERDEYRDRNRIGPKNQPFDALEEVEQVLGAPPGLADALRPYATIYSGEQSIDGNLARRSLVVALANPRSELARQEAMRTIEGASQDSAVPADLASGAGGHAFRVLAKARTAQGAVFVREAVVDFVAARPDAYAFRRWRKGPASASDDRERVEDPLLIGDMPPC